jgi:CHASE2 domain-containing sensor protein
MSAPAQAPPEHAQARGSPYQGIVPYGEADAEWFFGRSEWRAIVIDNLRAYRVSVLYGESGVGKSSLLEASVLPRLRAQARARVAAGGTAEVVPVRFSDWTLDDPLAALKEAIREAAGELAPARADDGAEDDLAAVLAASSERLDGALVVVVLDQFEEFFLYHPADAAGRAFEDELTSALRSRSAPANVLLGIREDALAKLDRLQARVPGLLDNLLRLEHLAPDDAREAVERPLEHWNEVTGEDVGAEPAFVEGVLAQVQAGKLLVSGAGGAGRVQVESGDARIEAPFLQVVLVRVWDEERAAGSRVLRLATLERLGGAERIVRTHLDQVLASFPRRDRDAAAKVFRYLVTPSGTKIAHRPADLAEYAGVREERLAPLLAALAGEPRILRPVSGGAYEIYHDVLTAAVLDWRRRYEEERSHGLLAQRYFLGAAAAVAAIMIVAYLGNVLGGLEQRTVNERYSILHEGNPDVVVVGIDAKTFGDFGNRLQWPFPRRYEAKVIDRIAAGHPKVTAIDIQFTVPTDARDDNALIKAVTKGRPAVLAATQVDSQGRTDVFGGDLPPDAHAGSVLLPAASTGSVSRVANSVDGLTSFGIVAAALARGEKPPPARPGSHVIDFAGPPGAVKTYSFSDVYRGAVPPRAFRSKVVVLGLTAPSFQDVHPTPRSNTWMSGAELQANVVESALRGFPRQPQPLRDALIIAVLALVVPLSSIWLGWKWSLALAVGLAAAYVGVLQPAFDHGVLLPVVYPLLALAIVSVLVLGRQLRRSAAWRRRFGR